VLFDKKSLDGVNGVAIFPLVSLFTPKHQMKIFALSGVSHSSNYQSCNLCDYA